MCHHYLAIGLREAQEQLDAMCNRKRVVEKFMSTTRGFACVLGPPMGQEEVLNRLRPWSHSQWHYAPCRTLRNLRLFTCEPRLPDHYKDFFQG